MTLHIADIAGYQAGITSAQLWAAGMGGINVKVSHGLGRRSVHERADQYVREARAAGKALSSFHWLTGDASGVAQADYAYREMAGLGLNVPGVAHVVDVEALPGSAGGVPTDVIYRDYVGRMQKLLQRPIITYTGDWWQQAHGWLVALADLSPWLWAAPNSGYQASYPGDTSPLWDAGYGGWRDLAVMQYRVSEIAGIKVSQSAVRSADLWADMTGVPRMASWVVVPCLLTLRDEFNELAPGRDKGSDGTIGDTAHTSSSDHTPDEDSRVLEDHDADEKNEVHALDTDSTGPWPGPPTQKQKDRFRAKVMAVIAGEKAKWLDPDDRCRLNYVIWDGQIYDKDNDFEPVKYNGSDQHTGHAHFSARYETSCENDTRPWGVLEEEMTKTEFIAWLTEWAESAAGKKALGAAVGTAKTGNKAYPGRDNDDLASDEHAFLDDWVGDGKGAAVRPTKPGSLGEKVRELAVADVPGRLDTLEEKLDTLIQAHTTPPTK